MCIVNVHSVVWFGSRLVLDQLASRLYLRYSQDYLDAERSVREKSRSCNKFNEVLSVNIIRLTIKFILKI